MTTRAPRDPAVHASELVPMEPCHDRHLFAHDFPSSHPAHPRHPGRLRRLVAGLITLYQRFISPHKGFSCAYRVANGGLSCSEYVKQALLTHGFKEGFSLTRQRFAECKLAVHSLRAQKELEIRSPLPRQGRPRAKPRLRTSLAVAASLALAPEVAAAARSSNAYGSHLHSAKKLHPAPHELERHQWEEEQRKQKASKDGKGDQSKGADCVCDICTAPFDLIEIGSCLTRPLALPRLNSGACSSLPCDTGACDAGGIGICDCLPCSLW